MFAGWELERLGLAEYFDGIYLSSDYGVKKPDRRFFQALLRERNIAPETAVMVGNDGLCDVRGGRDAGMDTIYIRSNLSPDEPTPEADYVLEQMEAGRDVILEIEIQGALKVKERFPDTLLLFVTPPTAGELENRLRGRGTETEEVIHNRLKRAVEEAELMDQYDYILVNDDLDVCVQKMHELIQAQHLRTDGNRELIARIRRELRNL